MLHTDWAGNHPRLGSRYVRKETDCHASPAAVCAVPEMRTEICIAGQAPQSDLPIMFVAKDVKIRKKLKGQLDANFPE
jgi:hypothetical protein